MIARVEFGEDAIGHLRSQLMDWGTFSLLQFLTNINLEAGCVFGYLDREYSADRLADFSNLLVPRRHLDDTPEEWRKTHRAIATYLAESSPGLPDYPRMAIVPFTAQEIVPWAPLPAAYFEYKVPAHMVKPVELRFVERYSYLRSGPVSLQSVEQILYQVSYFCRRCILTSGARLDRSPINVAEGYVRDLAENTEHIFFAAYDGDAMLVWSKDKTLQERFESAAQGLVD